MASCIVHLSLLDILSSPSLSIVSFDSRPHHFALGLFLLLHLLNASFELNLCRCGLELLLHLLHLLLHLLDLNLHSWRNIGLFINLSQWIHSCQTISNNFCSWEVRVAEEQVTNQIQ